MAWPIMNLSANCYTAQRDINPRPAATSNRQSLLCKQSVPWVIREKVILTASKSVSAEFKNATWKCQAIYVNVLSDKEDHVSWYVGQSIRIPMTCGDERVVCTNNEYRCGESSKIIQRGIEERSLAPVSSDVLDTASCTLFESV